MDKREELRRKLERIEREETAKQEKSPEQSEVSAPSTEAASASPPPAPSLTPEQVQEITRGEIEKALRAERAARREESASERARNDARFDDLSQGLTDTNEHLTETDERVTSLREDTHDSLIPMAKEIAELRSRQNSRALPPAWEPRNVTPHLTLKPGEVMPPPSLRHLLSPPSTYRPLPRTTEPEAENWPPKPKPYPRPQIESSPPQGARSQATEQPAPLLFVAIQAALIITLLITVIWIVVTLLLWAWAHLLLAVALAAALLITLIWIGAILLFWSEAKIISIIIFLVGATTIFGTWTGYTVYQSLTKPKPDINELGR